MSATPSAAPTALAQALLASQRLGVAVYAADTGACLEVNEALARMVGGTVEAMRQQNLRTLPSWEESGLARAAEATILDGSERSLEVVLHSSFGRTITVDASLSRFEDAGRAHLLVAVVDVTERRKAEEALAARERELRNLVETMPDFIVRYDREMRRTYVNPAWEKAAGLSSREVVNVRAAEVKGVPRPLNPEYQKAVRSVLDTGATRSLGFTWVNARGTELFLEYIVVPEHDAEGRIVGALAVGRDLTEHKRAEAALRRLNRELRAVSDCNQILVRAESEGALLSEVSRIICADAGYRASWVAFVERGAPLGVRIAVQAGADLPPEGSLPAWGDPRGQNPVATALRSGGTVCIQDVEGDPDAAPWRDDALARGYRAVTALPLRVGDQAPLGVWLLFAAEPAAFSVDEVRLLEELASDLAFGIRALRDRRARARMEEQLRQSQKLEAVGRLAGGVAHDFNNLLTAILGSAGELADQLGEASPLRGEVAEIREAAQRAAGLTRQLLAFGRRQVAQPQVVELGERIDALQRMLRRIIGERIELQISVAPGLGRVLVDPGHLEQVVVNLAVNARDAMGGVGRLTIAAANVGLTAEEAVPLEIAAGPHVLLAVGDDGAGMPPEVRAHLFEPFFTTKGPGQGTGLGLSTVYGIVKEWGGAIAVESEVGRGSTFRIFIPRADGAPDAAMGKVAERRAVGGTESVLVIEDDPAVRARVVRTLGAAGYAVLEAADGPEAVARVAAAAGGRLDLLVTDVVLPRVGGPEVAARLRRAWPELRVLFVSGYTEQADDVRDLLDLRTAFLAKPFAAEQLIRAVRELLDRGRDAGRPAGEGETR